MANHDPSLPARRRRGTQKGRPNPRRPIYHALAKANGLDSERAFETTRALIPSPRALADYPGVLSESALSHWRTDMKGPVHRLDALIRAALAVGQPPETCHAVLQHFEETIDRALDGACAPLPLALQSEQAFDAEQDVARTDALVNGDRRRYEAFEAKLRAEIIAKKAALRAVTRALARGEIQ